ncbi:MAG: flagellar export chaperone FliS [Burkholderiaceae bacterium]
MFASPHSATRSIAGLYQEVQVDTGVSGASPHRLIDLLFEEFIGSCARARGAIRTGDVQEKGRAIGRAVRIVEEGLRGGLNLNDGGELARTLQDLYGYVSVRLTQANLHSDDALIAECMSLVQPIHEAWRAIAPREATPGTVGSPTPQ